jgi:hypothetical protein
MTVFMSSKVAYRYHEHVIKECEELKMLPGPKNLFPNLRLDRGPLHLRVISGEKKVH